MATRAFIGIKLTEDNYRVIYSHFDGYIEGLGKALLERYNSHVAVLNLVMEGDCSFPGTPYEEEDTQHKVYNSRRLILETAKDYWVDYVYIYDEYWTVITYSDFKYNNQEYYDEGKHIYEKRLTSLLTD